MTRRRQSVLFLIDTQGANCVGCHAGRPGLGTPHVDRLAAQGVRFDAAYTCSPVCGPARSAILTGLYPHSNGVLANDQAPHLDLPTIGQRLRRAGFRTGYIGKWHLDGTDYFGNGRCPDGWDPAYWFDGRNYLESLPDDAARDLSRRVLLPREIAQAGITAEFTHAHRIAERAVDFIRRHRDEDFFLVVSIDEPHHPFIAPEPFASAFESFHLPIGPSAADTLKTKPRAQREWAAHAKAGGFVRHVRGEVWTAPGARPVSGASGAAASRASEGTADTPEPCYHNPAYFACNSFSDHEVGRVLAAIDASTPDALVVYTADHGDMFFAHGLSGKGPAMYEEVARVPLIVRWPGRAPPGAVAPHPVSHIHLVPTFLDFFGIEPPPLLHGSSLLPVVHQPGRRCFEQVFIEFNRFEVDHDGFGAFAPIRCAFDGRYKLAVNLLDTDELYDLAEDPAELVNCIDDARLAGVRARLHDALLEWMNQTRDPLRGPHWGRRTWRDLGGATWGGPTRPRPFDPEFQPPTLLYDTGRVIDRWVYDKG
jgi:uncharacterized sulfatase